VLKIMHQRARYLGLYPDSGKGGVHVNIGGDPDVPNAETEGIQITFVRPSKWTREDSEKVINSRPVLDHSEANGPKS